MQRLCHKVARSASGKDYNLQGFRGFSAEKLAPTGAKSTRLN